jgi:hypothetical protein
MHPTANVVISQPAGLLTRIRALRLADLKIDFNFGLFFRLTVEAGQWKENA